MILIMSAIMKPTATNSDHLETLLSILRSLKSNGNIPAVDFCERLSQIRTRVSSLRAAGRLDHTANNTPFGRSRPTAALSGRATPTGQEQPLQTPISVQSEALGHDSRMSNVNDIDILGDPVIGNFLDGKQMQLLDSFLPEGGIPSDFGADLDEQLLFGSW